jgi:hypothetical protein
MALKSNFWTIGSSTSSGSRARARSTLSRTSWAFMSTSYWSPNSIAMRERPWDDIDLRVRMPSMALMCSSSTSVTSRSTVSGDAPRSSVTT